MSVEKFSVDFELLNQYSNCHANNLYPKYYGMFTAAEILLLTPIVYNPSNLKEVLFLRNFHREGIYILMYIL